MKYKNKIGLLLTFAVGLLIETVSGQDSLTYYLEQAGLHNPGLNAMYLNYSAALEKVPQAASLPDPQLQAGYFLKPMELIEGSQRANVQIMQMFPWFGTLKAAKDEASKMALVKFEEFINARNELYMNVKTSYYQVYQTTREIEITEKNLVLLHSLEQLSIVKFSSNGASPDGNAGGMNVKPGNGSGMQEMNNNPMQNGSGNGNLSANSNSSASSGNAMNSSMPGNGKADLVSVLKIQIELKELESRLAFLKDELVTRKAGFNRYLDRPASLNVYTDDSLAEADFPSDVYLWSDSLKSNPMVKMYEAEAAAGDARYKMNTRMGYPMIGLGLNYMIIGKSSENMSEMNGKDMLMPMVSVSIPIYRKKYKAMRKEADIMKQAALKSLEDALNNLGYYYQQTLRDMNDAERRIKLYSEQVTLANQSLQLLITTYSSANADLDEILRMEQQLLDFEFKKVEAIVDSHTSQAQLNYLITNE